MSKGKTSKTKLQLHQEKKKELNESLEYLRQVDLPESQGGAGKFVRDTRKEEKKKDKEDTERAQNYLESRIAQRFGYRDRVANYAMQQTYTLDVSDWEYWCVATDGTTLNVFGKRYKTQEGVVHVLKSPKGNVYIRAVGISYDPEVDIQNVKIMLEQARNTIDSEKGLLLSDNKDTQASFQKSKQGLWLPN